MEATRTHDTHAIFKSAEDKPVIKK